VRLEDGDDLGRNGIAPDDGAVAGGAVPPPVVRVPDGDVDRDAVAVHAGAVGAGDDAAVERARGRKQEAVEAGGQGIELAADRIELTVDAVDGRDLERLAPFARQPDHVD